MSVPNAWWRPAPRRTVMSFSSWPCRCASLGVRGRLVNQSLSSKSVHKRLAHEVCHPERSEGSHGQILRCAQNDNPEWLHCKVSQRHVLRFIGCVAHHHKKEGVRWQSLESLKSSIQPAPCAA